MIEFEASTVSDDSLAAELKVYSGRMIDTLLEQFSRITRYDVLQINNDFNVKIYYS